MIDRLNVALHRWSAKSLSSHNCGRWLYRSFLVLAFAVISSAHPPAKAPGSDSQNSSCTNWRQAPFGLLPSKTDSGEFPLGSGADVFNPPAPPGAVVGQGAALEGGVIGEWFCRLVIRAQRDVDGIAASPDVSITCAVCPRGPTSSTYTSSGWE